MSRGSHWRFAQYLALALLGLAVLGLWGTTPGTDRLEHSVPRNQQNRGAYWGPEVEHSEPVTPLGPRRASTVNPSELRCHETEYRALAPQQRVRGPLEACRVPPCLEPNGTIPVTFSWDQGHRLVPVRQPEQGHEIVAIIALEEPGGLVANYDNEFYRSHDAGCTWSKNIRNDNIVFPYPPQLFKGAGGRVYGYLRDRQAFTLEGNLFSWLSSAFAMVGLGADRMNPEHLRGADTTGQLWDSFDGGSHWQVRGVAPPYGASLPPSRIHYPSFVAVAFDPSEVDHAVFTSREES